MAQLSLTSHSTQYRSFRRRMMELVVTTGAISRAKIQSNRHHQQTNTQLFTVRMPFLSPNQQCQTTERSFFVIDNIKSKLSGVAVSFSLEVLRHFVLIFFLLVQDNSLTVLEGENGYILVPFWKMSVRRVLLLLLLLLLLFYFFFIFYYCCSCCCSCLTVKRIHP